MKVEILDTYKNSGSCNFCDKGRLNESGQGLIYPYRFVYNITKDNGSGLSARLCQRCMDELIKKAVGVSELDATTPH